MNIKRAGNTHNDFVALSNKLDDDNSILVNDPNLA
jgi:hypothetical protein